MSAAMSILQSISEDILGIFYEETQVARFVTDNKSIGAGYAIPDPTTHLSDHSFFFDAPGVLEGSVAAVFFQTTPSSGTDLFSARLATTGIHLIETTFENADVQTWQFLSGPGDVIASNNELIFGVGAGGSVTVRNVLVLYTSTQLTVKRLRGLTAK